ncbi:hypothetical protein [Flavobacterium gawalongense]|uniref:Uncharacterized protein n=1 Tax=Flavobacterium gawalongense TaxID=2594432 RepID=A0A553BS52_9FLAO|nr:hypothetical protein [Flavobacterium gawalongense]TRX11049.1 hypothetical protein FNW11_06640 [Flavobacterium gawalongense]TRX11988.1 hypothetical protein FNW10_05735 [Flavobacterium gawalongense]TRX29834.1 hypothetical protein FNW38_05830 [Flavobacterium gawalongense]
MTEKDFKTLQNLAENFEKADGEINYLASDSKTYTSEEYDSLEKKLKVKLEEVILEFKNKYLVLPTFKIENSDEILVSLNINRYSINPLTLYNQMCKHQIDHQ